MSHTDVTTVVTEGARVRIVYKDHAGEVTERVIDVERVWECKGGATCILAFCHRRGERRTFDQARILFAAPDSGSPLATFASDRPPGVPVPDGVLPVARDLGAAVARLNALLAYNPMESRWANENLTA
jgi:hypothetical protein